MGAALTRAPREALPRGFHALIAAQFASALADNALLIVTIALLHQQGMAPWLAPLLKVVFTLAYVGLAPFIGPLSDAVPKARLMAWMNALKMAGVALLLLGVHPLLGYAVVGVGAAAYAPAKYGLVTELVPAHQLVAANGWIEVSVVCAVLLGTLVGGLLVSELWLHSGVAQALAALAASPLAVSLVAVLGVHGAASWINRHVPDSGARYPASGVHVAALTRDFWRDHLTLWRDPEGGLSLAATTVFWGAGAVLQFIVLRWAGEALALPLSQAAVLQGVVAVGVVAGAAAAGRWVSLAGARRMLVFGVVLGLALPLMAPVRSLTVAVPMLVGVGLVGGLLVVPLNALLQHRGCQLLSAGRSIAVQGFNENASILLVLGGYAVSVALQVPLASVMTVSGLAIAGVLALLMVRSRALDRRPTPDRTG